MSETSRGGEYRIWAKGNRLIGNAFWGTEPDGRGWFEVHTKPPRESGCAWGHSYVHDTPEAAQVRAVEWATRVAEWAHGPYGRYEGVAVQEITQGPDGTQSHTAPYEQP